MRASYLWLKELTGLEASVSEVAEKLTSLGLEVEAIEHFPVPEKVVVAEVLHKEPHPKRGKLTVVRVNDGSGEEQQVLCGAPNVPEPGGKVLFAQIGASLGTPKGPLVIAEREMGGIPSRGMICSESELRIGAGSDGIMVLPKDAVVGTPLGEALPVGDTVFEVGLTPNRPDCLGHIGIARDLAAAFGAPFRMPSPGAPVAFAEGMKELVPETESSFDLHWAGAREIAFDDATEGLGPFSVSVDDPVRCPRYGAALVLNVTDRPSPFWLRYRLHVLGLRSLGALVDATNLVMLEYGHPIHGFDLEKLRGRRIEVRLARDGERMETLDGVERELSSDDLLICDAEGPVALAGVMGAASSEISGDTKHVAIECAYFDPRSVRRTSRRLDMHTDASHRFERGVDPNAVRTVLARASALIAKLGAGVAIADAVDVYPAPIEKQSITLRHQRLEALVGMTIPPEVPETILGALGCEVTAGDPLEVKAPTWRPDLVREVDLIEEVARVHGYDRIPVKVPRVQPSTGGTAASIRFERRAREAAAAAGLFEAVGFAFVTPEELEGARVSTDAVRLAKPLGGRAVMRTSLLPGLVQAAGRALRRQAGAVTLFELGRTFSPVAGELPEEKAVLGVVLGGSAPEWIAAERSFDVYDLKGYLASLVELLCTRTPTLEVAEEDEVAWLHPRRQGLVRLGGVVVGRAGEVHPEVSEAFEVDGRLQYAELDVASLFGAVGALGVAQAVEPPRHPASTRDIALLVEEAVTAADVEAALRAGAGGLVESVALFDLYRGEELGEGKKSLAFRIVYRDPKGTLTDKKVDKAHAKATRSVKDVVGAEVR